MYAFSRFHGEPKPTTLTRTSAEPGARAGCLSIRTRSDARMKCLSRVQAEAAALLWAEITSLCPSDESGTLLGDNALIGTVSNATKFEEQRNT